MTLIAPPWELFGELIVARISLKASDAPTMAPGVKRLRGLPALIIAERFTSSPFGEFLMCGVAIPARIGVRPGLAFPIVAVSSEEVRRQLRQHWGYVAQVGDLQWGSLGHEREIRWGDKGMVIRANSNRVPFPLLLPFRSLLRQQTGPSISPVFLRGLARRANVRVEVANDESLQWLGGSHRGLYISSNRLRLSPSRTPIGMFSSLRAPVPAPQARMQLGD